MKVQNITHSAISISLVILLCFGLVGFLFSITLNRTLLTPGLYLQSLDENGFFDIYPTLFGNLGALGELTPLNSTWSSDYITQLGEDTFSGIIAELFPTDWMQEQIRENGVALTDYLRGNVDAWLPQMDFLILKEAFTDTTINLASTRLLQGLPACNNEQQAEWESLTIQQTIAEIPFCRPPVSVIIDPQPFIQDRLLNMITSLPDNLTILQTSVRETWAGEIYPAIQGYRSLIQLLSFTPLLLLISGGGLILINRKSLAVLFRWLSAGFIGSGVIGFILVGIGIVTINQISDEISSTLLINTPVIISQMIGGIVLQLGSTSAFWFALSALGCFVAGVIILLIASLIPEKASDGSVSIKLKHWNN